MEFRPHDYQKQAIAKIINVHRCGLFLDMGLGKTVITLTAVNDLLFDRFDIRKVLVIAPLRVAESTWGVEIDKWDHLKDLTVSLVLGSVKDRIKALSQPANIYIINRDNITWLSNYLSDWDFDMIVIDELSSFKNSATARFKSLRKHIRKAKRVLGLTGTPSPNGLMDLWSQIYLLDSGERLGKTLTQYRDTYFIPGRRNGLIVFDYNLRDGADLDIQDKISDICISMSAKDYLQLPDKIFVDHRLTLTDRRVYDALERDLYFEFATKAEVTAITKATLVNKLLQVANGAVYTDTKYEVIHDIKFDKLEEIVDGALGKPILCFYQFKHDADRILGRFPYAKLLVDIKLNDWSAGKVKLLLAHPASSGYGLNLQGGGNIIVWFGLPWSLELYQQSNARLHRQGQTNKVYIHHIVCADTVDDQVLSSLSDKTYVQDKLMDYLKFKYMEV